MIETMKKIALLSMLFALLVSCGESPESALKKELASVKNIAVALNNCDSYDDVESQIKEETQKMKELCEDVRAMKKYTEEDFMKAHVQACQQDENIYAVPLLIYAVDKQVAKCKDDPEQAEKLGKKVAEPLMEYACQLLAVEVELGKSCHMDENKHVAELALKLQEELQWQLDRQHKRNASGSRSGKRHYSDDDSSSPRARYDEDDWSPDDEY